jgi:hypothetical protein
MAQDSPAILVPNTQISYQADPELETQVAQVEFEANKTLLRITDYMFPTQLAPLTFSLVFYYRHIIDDK